MYCLYINLHEGIIGLIIFLKPVLSCFASPAQAKVKPASEVFTVPHIFRAESTESEHLARTLHGLAGCQFGTGPCIIGTFSPHRVCTESELNAWTPQPVLRLVRASASRNPIHTDCPNYLIKSRKNWHWHDSNPHPLGYNSKMHAATRLFGHGFMGLLGNEVPHQFGLACMTPNEATTAPTPDQPTTTKALHECTRG